ncbi:MAG: bifunctional folylpolyglutamate synthase/dihydrofolate synthase [Lachnospiraceae bacterium]|nr:bifunctional folylpolyglutamate synthase/dihydrofolate synthase [Lachnospiraceae bacterium]
MTEREAEEFRQMLRERGSRPGLERVSRLAEELGNPQDAVPCVHIAGTNGKGSVLAYMSTVLKEAGYATGSFFSPALGDEREMIGFGGKPITKKLYLEGWERISRTQAASEVTLFEAQTVLAYWFFREKGCDVAVVECGMGGAGDATSILKNAALCVFVPISSDHTAVLGNGIGAIAREKSGIITEGTDVVSAVQTEEAGKVLELAAKKAGASFVTAQEPRNIRYGLSRQTFDCGAYKKLAISLAGVWQPQNAALAVTALSLLGTKGFPVSEKALRNGLEKTSWYGRFSVLKRKPLLIADGAHNEAGAQALADSLARYFPDKKVVLLMGVLRDKDHDAMLRILLPYAEQLVCLTPPDNPRALPAMELAEEALRYSGNVSAAGSVEEGLEMALLLADGKMPVMACGSLSWLQRLKKITEGSV